MSKTPQPPDQHLVEELYRALKGEDKNGHAHPGHANPGGSKLTDQAVLEKMFAEKAKGEQWQRTYHGDYADYYPSPSEAVAAILRKTAFYSGNDPIQMDRISRGSALATPKFDEARGGSTWIADEIAKAIEATPETYQQHNGSPIYNGTVVDSSVPRDNRSSFSSSHYPLGDGDDDENNEIQWFHELGEPKEREFIVEDIVWKSYPVVAYGAGGVAKSLTVLAGGVAIASEHVGKWLGFKVLRHGYVLYLDFELDVDEQHRRVRDLCNGMGVPTPKRLAYLSGVGVDANKTFRRAYKFCKEHEPVAIIIDSAGMAMSGDMDRSKDINAFYRLYVEPFRRLGVTPLLVDHEGKRQSGEKHKDKSPIGSVYKTNNSRNVLQFILDEYDKENSALDIQVRQHKTNGKPIDPFGLTITFKAKKVTIEERDLPDAELIDEERKPVRERIRAALRIEPHTVPELEKVTGAAVGTIYNNLSRMVDDEEVVQDGYKGRKKIYRLFSSSPPDPRVSNDDENDGDESGLWEGVL